MKVSGPAFRYVREVSSGASLSFNDALQSVRNDLRELSQSNSIFEAHYEIADDPMIVESFAESLSRCNSESDALADTCDMVCGMFSDIEDEYLKARVDDVRDVFRRIADKMNGASSVAAGIPFGSVLVADEFFPSDTAALDLSRVCGIVCNKGSRTSHVCIIAHSKGIPVNTGIDISTIRNGDMITVDDPMVGESDIPSLVRASGRKLYVNAGSVDDVRKAISAGADGIGLFRTEFLFLDRASMPDEEEQFLAYKAAVEACMGKPIIIRTLDIGGDKALPWLQQIPEDNPFLGLRGVRLCLAHPEILKTQLNAVLRAAQAPGSDVRIMIPMVCSPDEVLSVRKILSECANNTGSNFLPPVGIMIETPASVFCAYELASVSDFFSVGTNDLTQYVMAADRGNASVSYLYDPLSKPVRSALEITVKAAHTQGISVGICGELASDPGASSFLIETGFDSLSLSTL